MGVFLNNRFRIILAILFVLSILPFLGKVSFPSNREVAEGELFRPELCNVNTLEKAIRYTDSLYATYNTASYDTAKYVKAVTRFTKERFYHGLAVYDFSENWITYLCGKYFWTHLSAVVSADDILKHPEGLCSQQTIVFMEILKRKNIHVRSVGLGYTTGPGHFLAEAHYKGSWHLHDVTVEPVWSKVVNHHESMNYYLLNKDSLYLAYEGKYDRPLFNKLLEKVVYGEVDDFPAKKMLLFHRVTYVLTYLLPLFFLGMFLFVTFRKKQHNQEFQISEREIKTEVVEQYS